jgi:hypothetical protein
MNNLPLNFRAVEVRQILSHLAAGESCQIIGANGSGKSNLMQYLSQPGILEHYLGEEGGKYLLVYLNIYLLIKQNDWGLYELMLHKLITHLEMRGVPEHILQSLDEMHRRATDKGTMHLALRYLDRALSMITQIGCERIVFLFDEFGQLVRDLSPDCYSALRGLRDEHKYQLMYVTASDRMLGELREDSFEFELFNDLLCGHPIWLMCYSLDDTRLMVDRIAARSELSFNTVDIESIFLVSGGHPGLIRALLQSVRRGLPVEEAVLADDPQVKDECHQIWRSLAVSEQHALMQIASGFSAKIDIPTALHLQEKGLAFLKAISDGSKNNPSLDSLFSPLFTTYLRNNNPAAGLLIEIDRKRREVWVQNRRIPNLTAQEFSCLDYLDQHRGEACRPEAIASYYHENMSGSAQSGSAEVGDDVYRSAVDATIKRLRKKIEPNSGNPRFILNVRSIGYKLVDGTG